MSEENKENTNHVIKEKTLEDICNFLKKNFRMHHIFFIFAILEFVYILYVNSFGDFEATMTMFPRLGVANLLLLPVFFGAIIKNMASKS